MRITKLGHCCLLIEENGVRILTDPGAWSTAQNEVKNIDLILITHEHPDHLHIDSVKMILQNSPDAVIWTNSAVGRILSESGVSFRLLEHGQADKFKGINLEGRGEKHAVIYEEYGQVQNTGFMIGDRFFYPGDNLFNPKKDVEILALPVAGPWLKISESLDYAKEIKPKIAFPVHDAMININMFTGHHALPKMLLPKVGIEFNDLREQNWLEI
ncbi:MAG: MBL fold metallo-hydrolase [Candidatus Doudnabacteria bacterium]|nr:MBL fold metallo-hydrolase [Candidatus Doudnabacteria bacterium]